MSRRRAIARSHFYEWNKSRQTDMKNSNRYFINLRGRKSCSGICLTNYPVLGLG